MRIATLSSVLIHGVILWIALAKSNDDSVATYRAAEKPSQKLSQAPPFLAVAHGAAQIEESRFYTTLQASLCCPRWDWLGCQGWGRRFESGFPLWRKRNPGRALRPYRGFLVQPPDATVSWLRTPDSAGQPSRRMTAALPGCGS